MSQEDLDAFVATQRSARTAGAYRRDLSLFRRYLDAVPPTGGPVDLEHYRDWLAALGDGPATIRRRLAAVAAFLRWRDGVAVAAPRVALAPSATPTLGLYEMAALIGAVDGPDTVREGVACLLFASRVATVDGLIALGPEHLGTRLRMTIDGSEIRFPRSMRGTLELLLRSAEGGRLFGGLSRQTLTRRIKTFGAGCGVEGCTPRSLRRSSGQITVESVALLTGTAVDPQRVPPEERLGLIVQAVRERLQSC